MSTEEILRSNEQSVLDGKIVSHVTGRKAGKKRNKAGKFSATAFVTALLLVFVVLFSSGNLIPWAVSEQLIEETDVQYADAVESKILVFQQAMMTGDVPNNTIMRLKESGVLVGYIENGEFIEGKNGGSLVLKMGDKIIQAKDFVNAIHSNAVLYDAFNEATYSRAAYYYDEAAQVAFRQIGTSRNNYVGDADFEEVMSELMGDGSNIGINSVALFLKEDDKGNKYYEYDTVGAEVNSEASDFVTEVAQKNTASNSNKATINAASTLNTADKISKEQKSSLYYLAFMENISKMKAGDGNDSKINEAMNYLYEDRASEVVDVKTGKVTTVNGSMVESPSLYAVLSGDRVNVSAAENYSSDRVLKTVENQMGLDNSGDAISGAVTSTNKNIRGTIGRYLESGIKVADANILKTVTPTIQSSLVNNSFYDIGGVAGGEMLVEGAVNVGRTLAKASGATPGNATAARSYARLSNTVLAMDAEVDRMKRSPFDITSRNTFLGSIVYKMAIGMNHGSTMMKKMASLSSVVRNSIIAILPTSYADDEGDNYLTNFGDCETLNSIGAVGSATCATVATFDTSTLNDIFNDSDFINFVNENTELNNGVRTVKKNSVLANFILFSDERLTPDGVMDGGILMAISNGSSSVSFVSNILAMVKTWLGSNSNSKRIASGAAFVNSTDNADWDTYKYAQRYVSLARATAALRQYDGGETAYSNMRYFEGKENPVVAFLNEYYDIASK